MFVYKLYNKSVLKKETQLDEVKPCFGSHNIKQIKESSLSHPHGLNLYHL